MEKHLSKYKKTIFSKNLGEEHGPFGPSWLRLWFIERYCMRSSYKFLGFFDYKLL